MSKKPNLKPAPPYLNKLKGSYTLDDSLREKLSLTPNILTGSVKTWSNIKDVVDDYLDHSEVWEAQPQQFVLMLQTSLKTINNILSKQPASSTSITELLLKQYCSSLDIFYHHPKIVADLKLYYQKKELKKRDKDNLQQAHIQSNATASAMVLEKSRLMEEGSKKRLFDEIEDEDDCPVLTDRKSKDRSMKSAGAEEELTIDDISEISKQYEQSLFDAEDPFNPNPSVSKSQYSFVKNGKRFDYHAPSKNLISPKKPALSQSDHGYLSDLFEIRLSSDLRTSSSSATQTIFEAYRDEQYANAYIKSHEGAISFLNSALDSDNFMDTRKLWTLPGEGKFIDMMRHILTDYYQSCRRSTPINPSHERTFFCEAVVPIFKNFGIMVGSLSGSWCEKQLVESRRVWLPLKDFRVSGINRKLLDGILTNEAETLAVMLESSGSEATTPHSIDDTYKQLKSTSDFMKYIIAKYKVGSLKTLMKIQIPCVSVIENCLTLCLTSVHDNSKWKFVEARTCTIPTTRAEKKQWIKVFEFLAFLKHVVEKSLAQIDQLENESLGYVDLGSEELLVKDYFL
ncbi:uncharacterized protein EV154DRAFT_490493 [Mucor mucedo]|uniref:uncharacterized protein n=1 Tax=Mucor mucedo TaxID=29922 RepID=UPI00222105C1|nr:uncharacterized protein EV154DRAFT_490493 [Mucor mucedo]KAI7897115.1 hypothetical protein EV154DRAFT_490493 [Mucor mucedo]